MVGVLLQVVEGHHTLPVDVMKYLNRIYKMGDR
jgi:hypothetical protein